MGFRSTISLVFVVLAAAGCSSERADTSASRIPGWELKLGNGTVSSYAEFAKDGAPATIGVAWSATALEGLPTTSDEHRCHGRDKDGAIVPDTKCQHTHHFVIPLPDAVARRSDIPFKWVLLNWNPVRAHPSGRLRFGAFRRALRDAARSRMRSRSRQGLAGRNSSAATSSSEDGSRYRRTTWRPTMSTSKRSFPSWAIT